MTALEIIGIIFGILCLGITAWGILRINCPRTPEEAQAKWEQDLRDFDADMAGRTAND